MTKNGGKSGKVRFDGVDVSAMVNQMQRDLLGRRIINIYDGVSDSDSFLVKLDGENKTFLFFESGVRFYSTQHQSSLQQEGMPSPFCSKLRKHLRGLRLESVIQLGHYDRVVNFVFGTGDLRHSLILELYARGNIILTAASYEIKALLRSHEYEEVSVKVGEIYPVTYATSLGNDSRGLIQMTGPEALKWAIEEVKKNVQKQKDSGKQKKSSDSAIPLKAFLLKPSSGVYHYGPSLLEHCILCANLDPSTKISLATVENIFSIEEWSNLIEMLKVEGTAKLESILSSKEAGYILYKSKPKKEEEPNRILEGLRHTDKVLEEFYPYMLKQHEGRPILKYDTFAGAVDDFFAHLGGQKQALRAEAAEMAAQQKLEKIRKDQQQRVDSLGKEQEKLKYHAQLVEIHANDIEKALNVINSALDTGMDWEALNLLVEVEQKNKNPIALLIKKLVLERDEMILSLPDSLSTDNENSFVNVTVSLLESAYGNARQMFAKYRAFKEKSQKTLEASTKALQAAEANAQRQLVEAQKKSKLTTVFQAARKQQWFEKFHWFITTDNYLVLGGKDAHQNELLVKRYLRTGDAYLHADVHGAASCILRAKRRRKKDGKTVAIPLSDQALREAGNFTICRSSAWASKMVTSAWWVESHQVSKTAPSGEYLTVGSFMVRGKKNFLPPTQLEMGLAVLFKLGDDDSVARHLNDRRDFMLLDYCEQEKEFDLEEKKDDINSMTSEKKSEKVENIKPAAQEAEDENDKSDVKEELKEVSSLSSKDGDKANESMTTEEKEIPETQGADKQAATDLESNNSSITEKPKRKGLSVKERKLIKRYGSLEAAQKAIAEREKLEELAKEKNSKITATNLNTQNSQSHTQKKRGKKGKMKKAAKKYADQDDEDRDLALLALHGGEKKGKGNVLQVTKNVTESQEKAAAQTKALLVKDPAVVAEDLSDEVKDLLANCVTVTSVGEGGEKSIRWDKYDADILEKFKTLTLSEQQMAASRLFDLKKTSRIDNFSSSLAGIIRTIKRYGGLNLLGGNEDIGDTRRKTKLEKEKEKTEWKETLAAEGIADEDINTDGIDDTTALSKLTGIPDVKDSLLHAVPVCAPYQTLSKYKYRVKLVPGNLKRGKAAKQCVEFFLRSDSDKKTDTDRVRDLIKRVNDNDWVQAICSDVKISSSGAYKKSKSQKKNSKKK